MEQLNAGFIGFEADKITPGSRRAREIQEYANVMGIEALNRNVDWNRIPEWLQTSLVQRELHDYTSLNTL